MTLKSEEFEMKSQNKFNLRSILQVWMIITFVSVVVSLSGCANSQPIPNKSLWAAEQAVANAERARVSQYAAAELTQAREMLIRAKEAVELDKMEDARQLAEQSEVTAQLALSRAELSKAENINAEMKKSIDQ